MRIVNRTGSERVYVNREKGEIILLPRDQPVEVDDMLGDVLLRIEGFELAKEEEKRRKKRRVKG